MKRQCVCLPLMAAVLQFLVISIAQSQPILHDVVLNDRHQSCQGLTQGECEKFSSDTFEEENYENGINTVDDDEEDPMLQVIPGTDFKAYVRADIATFYRQPPGSRKEAKPYFNGQAAKFVNMSPDRVTIYWISDQGTSEFHGEIGPWEAKGTASFPGHRFTFTRLNQPKKVLCEINIAKDTSVYYCNPFVENNPNEPGQAVYKHPKRSLNELSFPDMKYYNAHIYNHEFGKIYKNFTGGSEWLTMYRRDPPRHKMWRADYFGQTHTVMTNETYFMSMPSDFPRVSIDQMRTPPQQLALHRAPGQLNLTIKAVSCAPRAFEVSNFLSEAEADHILDVVKQHELQRSTTGSGEASNVRTSRTTWIPRNTDAVINAVYRRAADVLRIDEALLRKRYPEEVPEYDTLEALNEDMQIVHYDKGQEYTPHHDFGYPTGLPGTPSRSINICFYLNTVPAGGHTLFPRWRNAETGTALRVKPEKTKAMIFYMINPDGNLDDLSQHAGSPVFEGEKWFSNLWIHDPYFSR